MPTTNKQAAECWPPDPNMPVEQQIEILVSVVDGMLALLPLGMIDTLRLSANRTVINDKRISRIEEQLGLNKTPDEDLIGESQESL